MEIRYERDFTDAYIILPVGTGREGYQRRMILENQIRGFLRIQKRGQDQKEFYFYRISGRVGLEEYVEHTPLKTAVLKQLIFSVCQSVGELTEYLLNEECLLLTPETIFIEEREEPAAFTFCLYPDERQDVRESLRQLMKYLMGKTDTEDAACASRCYELYGLFQKENFCLRECLPVLERTQPKNPVKEPEKKNRAKQFFASRLNGGIIGSAGH